MIDYMLSQADLYIPAINQPQGKKILCLALSLQVTPRVT